MNRSLPRPARPTLFLPLLALWAAPLAAAASEDAPRTGRQIYLEACVACHGPDGTGAPETEVAFDVPLPDFTDCSFATREPDIDWIAVTHDGGPARGFDRKMPAFGDELGVEEIERVLAYVRTFCGNDAWPRGELNFPRPMFTEKAYVEDEFVFTTGVGLEGPGAVENEILFEKRFGARNQLEVVVPFSVLERTEGGAGTGNWRGGLGDVALGWKRDLFHSLASGSILSATAEFVLPTGDTSRGFGKGTTVFEPFVSFGQGLGVVGFLHLQVGAELPFDTAVAENEGFARAVFGRSFNVGRWGRTFSPMVEVLTARAFESGADVSWDLVPQMQVTLNARQNLMANVAVRVPVGAGAGERSTGLFVYFLWDWFDGGLTEGW